MRVMWLINYPIPKVAEHLHINKSVNEGWLTGLADTISLEKNVELSLCFPQSSQAQVVTGSVDGVSFYGYPNPGRNTTKYQPDLKLVLCGILEKVMPDVLHLMGSEFPHCYSMIEAAKMAGIQYRTVISIQGLVSVYAKHYFAFMPDRVCRERTLRDILKQTSLFKERNDYVERGKYEQKAFVNVQYTIGRTDWDKACAYQMNPDITYFHGCETLRSEFYRNKWSLHTCRRYSLFVSQANYPIKGFHMVLQAFSILKSRYPDCHLYVASNVIYPEAMTRPRCRNSQYVNYICDLIRDYQMESYITYTGALSEKEMCAQYIKSHVFVSASSIENSPNSVGEAMILGMPVVSSDVGGVKNMMTHPDEGFVYPADEPYMLAHYISEIFDHDDMAVVMGEKARLHALQTHNPEKNYRDLISAYIKITEGCTK